MINKSDKNKENHLKKQIDTYLVHFVDFCLICRSANLLLEENPKKAKKENGLIGKIFKVNQKKLILFG